ncbi:hypothetical protein ERJ75_001270400 [Trypanosoma vivax]|nr:hypothetical protein ERJ75_001270400 [Trypanosoma vivax]
MLGLFVKLSKNAGDRGSAGTTLAVDKAAALRQGGTLATMAENLTQAIDATSTQGKMGQYGNAAKLLCDASATDFDALVAGARAEAAAAAQQANEELAASEGPHDTEETGAEDQKSTPQGGGHKASNKEKRTGRAERQHASTQRRRQRDTWDLHAIRRVRHSGSSGTHIRERKSTHTRLTERDTSEENASASSSSHKAPCAQERKHQG